VGSNRGHSSTASTSVWTIVSSRNVEDDHTRGATRLERPFRLTIVERGIIPTGASTRNAGFACFGSLTELIADSQKMGEDKMLGLVEMRYKGLKKIRKVFGRREIGYEEHGGYELIAGGLLSDGADSGDKAPGSPGPGATLSGSPDMNRLRSDIDRLNRQLKKITKLQKTFRMQDEKIAKFGFAGVRHLIENKAEAQLHSGKLCQALLKSVQGMGVTQLNNIEIKSFERTNGRLLLQTDRDFTLSAGQLLVCTNAFARQLLPELDIAPARGQVLVTSPIEGLSFKGAFHFDEGFYYFRDLGGRVLLGGARNKAFEEESTDAMTITDTIQQELERFLRESILPGKNYTIDHRWSGIMGMGSEKMPIVRQAGENIFCAVRMSGMGVALAPVVGEQIAELMLGKIQPS